MLRRLCYFQNEIAATMATALADVAGVLAAQGRMQDLAQVMRPEGKRTFKEIATQTLHALIASLSTTTRRSPSKA